jgi:hypothetical protein
MRRKLAAVGSNSLQEWADKINGAMAASVAAIIATGQAFIAAKGDLGHGNFERLFANHDDHIAEPVHCTIGTAERFMAIAEHKVLSKSAHAPLLPPSWRRAGQRNAGFLKTRVSPLPRSSFRLSMLFAPSGQGGRRPFRKMRLGPRLRAVLCNRAGVFAYRGGGSHGQ